MAPDRPRRSRPLRRGPRSAPPGTWLALSALLLSGFARSLDAEEADVALARRARPSVVRVRWRHERLREFTSERNAVVLAEDGLLLLAGPPPSRRGRLTAVFADGSELDARIVASDAETALTLLRVPTTGLTPLELRREAPSPAGSPPAAPPPLALPPLGLRVVMVTGDGAVAVGALRSHRRYGTVTDPDTRQRTRTTGLIGSALAAVDTDAGSPLLDAQGQIVGLMVGRLATVSTAKDEAARRGGLTFRPEPVEVVAVPAAVIAIALPLLEKTGRVPRAALGITTEPVDAALRAHLGLEGGGHVVRRVERDGPAERAGLQVHDVIVSVAQRPIEPDESMHDLLLPFRPGASVSLGVVRGRERIQVAIILGTR